MANDLEDEFSAPAAHRYSGANSGTISKITETLTPLLPRTANLVRQLQDPLHLQEPKPDDVPVSMFNELTLRIINELRETVESQITDAANRRAHAVTQMEQLKAEIDKVFSDHEANAKKHQQKVNDLAEAVKKKVAKDTEEMIALSQRLQEFANSVNVAHEKFFKD